MSSIYSQVIDIIASQAVLDVADVGPESTLEELGIDSLGIVEAIFAIEEMFDIDISFNANEPGESDVDFTSVGSIVEAVERLVTSKRG
ncbi:MAG: acyl carrier protein [Rhodobacteraceae bacterium]|nr:acyl carrier protein [Paracoccaceae bacterium]